MTLPIITFDTTPFRDVLNALVSVVPNKPQRDALKCFKIEAIPGLPDKVRISATDLEVFARTDLTDGVVVVTGGEFVIPAQILVEFIRTVESEKFDMVLQENDSVLITADSGKFEIGTQDLDEFPSFPLQPDDSEDWIEIPLPELSKALTRVLFAVAEKGHPKWGALSAVSMEVVEDSLLFIGTDQRRASLAHISLATTPKKWQALVSPTGLEIIGKLFSQSAKLYFGESNSLFLRSEKSVLISRLIHGSFPPVKSLIPKSNDKMFTIEPAALLKQVKKASLATDASNALKVEISNNKICLSTKTRQERKKADVEYSVQYTGPSIKFGVNCQYLLELLKASGRQDNLEVHIGDITRHPVMFKQDGFLHLLVPQDTK